MSGTGDQSARRGKNWRGAVKGGERVLPGGKLGPSAERPKVVFLYVGMSIVFNKKKKKKKNRARPEKRYRVGGTWKS